MKRRGYRDSEWRVGMRRRDFLAGSLAAGVSQAPLTLAIGQTARGPFTPIQPRFIDAHCHMFNVLDVPAESFIEKVVLKNSVAEMSVGNRNVAELFSKFPEAVSALVHMLATMISKRSCEPHDEIWVLDQLEEVGRRPRTVADIELKGLEEILDEVWWQKKVHKGLRGKLGQRWFTFVALDELKFRLRKEAYPERPDSELRGSQEAFEESDCRTVAKILYTEKDGPLSTYIRWALLFTRYRFQLVDELHRLHGRRTRLMTPALVDFSAWLDPQAGAGDRTASVRDQVEVFARIARRKSGPRVHGFVAFDPLRQALFDYRGGAPADEPMAVVKQAIEENGFIGVKLYPPMGFAPSGNAKFANNFPRHVRDAGTGLGQEAGARLDAALDKLYAWCAAKNAPIMVHTANSYGSQPGYGLRASPLGWVSVLKKYPGLRISMAHFGGFARFDNKGTHEQTWEWAIGEMFKVAENPHVYADISFFNDVLEGPSMRRQYIGGLFKRFCGTFPDAAVSRLIYGTDWTMIGHRAHFPSRATFAHKNDRLFPDLVMDFMRRELEFTNDQIDAVMFRNAARYMGLGPDQRAQGTRGRLEQFYERAGLSSTWLQEFDQV